MYCKSFDRIYYRIIEFFENFTAFYVKTIYSTVKKRAKDFRNFAFFRNGCITLNKYHFSSFRHTWNLDPWEEYILHLFNFGNILLLLLLKELNDEW